jgi:Arc/MetJ-type ribon-helix-helix transcriptional regulator
MGKKIKHNNKSVTIRLPMALYDALAECATLGEYHSVSHYVRDMIHASVERMQSHSSCE